MNSKLHDPIRTCAEAPRLSKLLALARTLRSVDDIDSDFTPPRSGPATSMQHNTGFSYVREVRHVAHADRTHIHTRLPEKQEKMDCEPDLRTQKLSTL
jgi:hypothetical protein